MKAFSKSTQWILALAVLIAMATGIKQYQQHKQNQALAMPDAAVQQLKLNAAQSQLKEIANAGHPLAARLIAEQTEDKQEAAKWYEKSAEAGDQKSRYQLGLAYLKGTGVTQNAQKARLWFSTAGKQGLYQLGMMTLKGEGGAKDQAKGIAMVETAAQNHDPAAIYTLGNWYRYGDYVNQDLQLAVKHYKQAANLQYVPALQELALALEMGEMGLDINPAQAHSLSEMAGHISHCKQDHTNEVKVFD
ncbi:tetratricopeptide repeat protein [Iodobacter fluviatilis]|uniref:Beta-lactamase hcpC n=1 Tax=Iodobacter fluviatilis TaxID=537 RepID=A0A377Q6W2_9NEIS|nr:tetratricopeptide repeat protein [Iodobacter fluviatilis]TCU86978.1 TPR repeat protein [Iodobacter fluviatilis]STQ90309.1 Putative beta-lactamase hcpC precursor [Iodobacter fluviatilis]